MSLPNSFEINMKSDLDFNLCIKVLFNFLQRAQKNSSFKLEDAGIIHKAVRYYTEGPSECEMSELEALNTLIKGIHIGQSTGSFTLEEAGILQNKILPFINKDFLERVPPTTTPTSITPITPPSIVKKI